MDGGRINNYIKMNLEQKTGIIAKDTGNNYLLKITEGAIASYCFFLVNANYFESLFKNIFNS